MALTENDVIRMAALARIDLPASQRPAVLAELNKIFNLIQKLQAAPTEGVEPLAHPLSAIEDVQLRLREDAVTEPSSEERRAELMANAPAAHEGLFLVPRVIE